MLLFSRPSSNGVKSGFSWMIMKLKLDKDEDMEDRL